MAGRNLELWQTRDGIWLVVDRADPEGVVINGDQLRDLRPMPVTTRTPAPPLAITLETRNFRALRRTNWTSSGVCVVVGPNGAGKTTLLTLLSWLGWPRLEESNPSRDPALKKIISPAEGITLHRHAGVPIRVRRRPYSPSRLSLRRQVLP
jgi:hypothetical protein